MTEIEKRIDKKSNIMLMYGLLGLSIGLSVVPMFTAAFGSLFAIMVVMIGAYVLRWNMPEESLTHNHMTFIARTIWIGGLYASIALTVGSYYLLDHVNNAPLEPCIQKFINVGPQTYFELSSMPAIFESCMASYVSVNLKVFIVSGAMVVVPAYIFFLLRFARGCSRAAMNLLVQKPLSWF